VYTKKLVNGESTNSFVKKLARWPRRRRNLRGKRASGVERQIQETVTQASYHPLRKAMNWAARAARIAGFTGQQTAGSNPRNVSSLLK
jgi:hypothetical protein